MLSIGNRLLVLFSVLSVAAVVPASERPDQAASSAREVGELIVNNLLSRDHMFYGDESLHYSEAATAVGALRFAAATADHAAFDRLVTRYEVLLDNDSALISRRPHVDMNVIGIVPLQIAIQGGGSAYLQQGLSFADSQWDESLENGPPLTIRRFDKVGMAGRCYREGSRRIERALREDRVDRSRLVGPIDVATAKYYFRMIFRRATLRGDQVIPIVQV